VGHRERARGALADAAAATWPCASVGSRTANRTDVYELACDVGGRVPAPHGGEFVAYESDEQFAHLAQQFVVAAADRIPRYRERFATIEATAAKLRKTVRSQSLDESISTGIALGLVGDARMARHMFARHIDYHESRISSGARSR
jgi:hypothetical protein